MIFQQSSWTDTLTRSALCAANFHIRSFWPRNIRSLNIAEEGPAPFGSGLNSLSMVRYEAHSADCAEPSRRLPGINFRNIKSGVLYSGRPFAFSEGMYRDERVLNGSRSPFDTA